MRKGPYSTSTVGRRLVRGRLGAALHRERHRRGLTQREAGPEIGMSQSEYCRYETGDLKPMRGSHVETKLWWWANGRLGACPLCSKEK